jgi:hypothetical protein
MPSKCRRRKSATAPARSVLVARAERAPSYRSCPPLALLVQHRLGVPAHSHDRSIFFFAVARKVRGRRALRRLLRVQRRLRRASVTPLRRGSWDGSASRGARAQAGAAEPKPSTAPETARPTQKIATWLAPVRRLPRWAAVRARARRASRGQSFGRLSWELARTCDQVR